MQWDKFTIISISHSSSKSTWSGPSNVNSSFLSMRPQPLSSWLVTRTALTRPLVSAQKDALTQITKLVKLSIGLHSEHQLTPLMNGLIAHLVNLLLTLGRASCTWTMKCTQSKASTPQERSYSGTHSRLDSSTRGISSLHPTFKSQR